MMGNKGRIASVLIKENFNTSYELVTWKTYIKR